MNFENRTLYVHDNLAVLRGMDSGCVDLVVTDPPYNKARDFHATAGSAAAGTSFKDRWRWDKDVDPAWVTSISDHGWNAAQSVIEGSFDAHSEGMAAYLCFMAIRLIEMRRVLKDEGSIYLHCDPTSSHYLKSLMDAIFGRENHLNELVWCYNSAGRTAKRFCQKHDIILRYSISSRFQDVRLGDGAASKGDEWWSDIPPLNSQAKERTGWPTQKPEALYERMILEATEPGQVVLDPFCGCSTTLMAAERNRRQWVGIEIAEQAGEMLAMRMKRLAETEGRATGRPRILKRPPTRTDAGEAGVPPTDRTDRDVHHLRQSLFSTRASQARRAMLLATQRARHPHLGDDGAMCDGCGREFDIDDYVEAERCVPGGDAAPAPGSPGKEPDGLVLLCTLCSRLQEGQQGTLAELQHELAKRSMLVKAEANEAVPIEVGGLDFGGRFLT